MKFTSIITATVAAIALSAGSLAQARNAASTGVAECDKMLTQMETCLLAMAGTSEERSTMQIQLDGLRTQMRDAIKEQSASRKEIIEACLQGSRDLAEEGCK